MTKKLPATHLGALDRTLKAMDLPDEATALVVGCREVAQQLDIGIENSMMLRTYLTYLQELRTWLPAPEPAPEPVLEEVDDPVDTFEALIKALK